MLLYVVGQNIRNYRKKSGMTQAELSFLSSTDTSHLGKIERGQWNATLATVNRIAVALDVPMSSLFNQGGETREDYTMLRLFVSTCVPYSEKLAIYDPLKLGDFLGVFLFDKITIQDVENAATQYLDSISYETVRETRYLPDVGRYFTYGIRATRKVQLNQTEVLHVSDVSSNRRKVEALVESMNHNHLYPIHFLDVVEDFCAANYTP